MSDVTLRWQKEWEAAENEKASFYLRNPPLEGESLADRIARATSHLAQFLQVRVASLRGERLSEHHPTTPIDPNSPFSKRNQQFDLLCARECGLSCSLSTMGSSITLDQSTGGIEKDQSYEFIDLRDTADGNDDDGFEAHLAEFEKEWGGVKQEGAFVLGRDGALCSLDDVMDEEFRRAEKGLLAQCWTDVIDYDGKDKEGSSGGKDK